MPCSASINRFSGMRVTPLDLSRVEDRPSEYRHRTARFRNLWLFEKTSHPGFRQQRVVYHPPFLDLYLCLLQRIENLSVKGIRRFPLKFSQ